MYFNMKKIKEFLKKEEVKCVMSIIKDITLFLYHNPDVVEKIKNIFN